MYVYIYIYRSYIYIYIYSFVCMCVCLYVLYMCKYVCIFVCMYICMYVCMSGRRHMHQRYQHRNIYIYIQQPTLHIMLSHVPSFGHVACRGTWRLPKPRTIYACNSHTPAARILPVVRSFVNLCICTNTQVAGIRRRVWGWGAWGFGFRQFGVSCHAIMQQ